MLQVQPDRAREGELPGDDPVAMREVWQGWPQGHRLPRRRKRNEDGRSAAAARRTASKDGRRPPAGALTRVWYGRMYLPPPDAVGHPTAAPFRAWRAFHDATAVDLGSASAQAQLPPAPTTADAQQHGGGRAEGKARALSGVGAPAPGAALIAPSGCAGGRRFLATANASLCKASQIFCWHQCVDVGALPCGAHAVCYRTSDDTIWTPQDEHCTSCEARCLSPPPPPAALSTSVPSSPSPPGWYDAAGQPFCTGAGTDMHMSGFTFYPADCVILLFTDWRLDSPSAFAGGVLATALLGILTELLTWLRRTKIGHRSGCGRSGRARTLRRWRRPSPCR